MSLLLLAWLGTAQAAPEMIPLDPPELVGRAAPAIEAKTLDGGTFVLEDQRGRPVILSFWASWCGPCRQELPALSAMAKERDDVAIFAVNVDRDPKRAERFLQQVTVDLPIVWDPDALALGEYQVMSMPTMFLLDSHLTVRWRKVGFSAQHGLTELEEALEKEASR